MSASLVGSEMCIRDSSGAMAFNGLKKAVAPEDPRETRPRAARTPGSARACLLYTSDAADDM
eukprot:2864533-Alexandrium_andersonii.AAC.1